MGWLQVIGQILFGPIIQAGLDAYKAKLTAENETDRIAADLEAQRLQASRDVALASLANWWSAAPMLAAEWIAVLFAGKVAIWDTMLGLGSTPALHGDVSAQIMMIWAGMFGYAAVGRWKG